MFLSYLSIRYLIILFPTIPLLFIMNTMAFRYFLKKDISTFSVLLNAIIQLTIGLILIFFFKDFNISLFEPISKWDAGIYFFFESEKIPFLIAYLVPLFFSIFFAKKLKSFYIKIIFLFYLTGCSGILVSGDIFNFFVFYEMMIMSAYILISIEGKYFFSVKYMIFSSISSLFLLLGIVIVYTSGLQLSFEFLSGLNSINIINSKLIITTFTFAFLLKGGFFPVSSLVNCHAVTNPLISAFLSSFTIFTSIFGLYYFVITPSLLVNFEEIFIFIRIIAFITLIYSSFKILFEKDLRIMIATTTSFSIAVNALLLSYQAYDLMFLYIAVHSVYKSILFLQYDYLIVDKLNIYINRKTFFLFIVLILLNLGLYPGIIFFIKEAFLESKFFLYAIFYFTMFVSLMGFFKFHYNFSRLKTEVRVLVFFILCLLLGYVFSPIKITPVSYNTMMDFILIAFASVIAADLYSRINKVALVVKNFFMKNFNFELFYIISFVFLSSFFLFKTF